jgi:hypothetical protein
MLLFWNQYKVFGLLYKCPMRPYTSSIYKGKERMSIRNTKGEENVYISNMREGGPGLFSWTDLLLLVSSILFLFS